MEKSLEKLLQDLANKPVIDDPVIHKIAITLVSQAMQRPNGQKGLVENEITDFYREYLIAKRILGKLATSDQFLEDVKQEADNLPTERHEQL